METIVYLKEKKKDNKKDNKNEYIRLHFHCIYKLEKNNKQKFLPPAGKGNPSFLAAPNTDNIIPPPALSPAKTILEGDTFAVSNNQRYESKQSSTGTGHGCSGGLE